MLCGLSPVSLGQPFIPSSCLSPTQKIQLGSFYNWYFNFHPCSFDFSFCPLPFS
jgi:hypothetical protein